MKKRIAVSIILTCDSGVLLVERNPRLSFFGGYWAFPGGTLEPQDESLAQRKLASSSSAAEYRVFVAAAARELFEETGVWLGRGPEIPAQRLDSYRRRLLAREISFGEILSREGQELEPADFTPLCRITTPPFSLTRYDTWFLLCRLPAERRVEIWPGELLGGNFVDAAQTLSRWRAGQLLVVPPVLIMLEELARDGSSFLERVRTLTASYARGKLHRVYFSCGVLVAPLKTHTRPPATHTNAYLVGEERLYLIDPGSRDPDELEKLWELVDELGREGRRLEGILLTHHHPDHTGSVEACQQRYGVGVLAHPWTIQALPELEFQGALQEGAELDLGQSPDGCPGWKLRVHHVPGHAPGHLAFQETRYQALIVGDCISTLSSILVDPSDGHLASYLRSLRRLESLAEGHVCPGHGAPARDGRAALRQAILHREEREEALLEALRKGLHSLAELLEEVYRDTPPALLPLAERSLRSGLIKLEEEGRVKRMRGGFRLLG